MAQKVFIVEGRQFRTESDYACAQRDKEIIDKLRKQTDFRSRTQLEALKKALRGGEYKFCTLLGQDFLDEVEAQLKKIPVSDSRGRKTALAKREKMAGTAKRQAQTGGQGRKNAPVSGGMKRDRTDNTNNSDSDKNDPEMNKIVEEELEKREKRRKLIIGICSALAVCCLGYFAVYSYYDYRTQRYNCVTYISTSGIYDQIVDLLK